MLRKEDDSNERTTTRCTYEDKRRRYDAQTKTFGQDYFSCCAPKQWSSLPSDICHIQSSHAFNPFTAPACKISGLKNARTRLQIVFVPVPLHQLSVLGILMEIRLFACSCEQEDKTAERFKISRFYWAVFKLDHGSERG